MKTEIIFDRDLDRYVKSDIHAKEGDLQVWVYEKQRIINGKIKNKTMARKGGYLNC